MLGEMSRVVTHLLARDGSFFCKAANNSGTLRHKREMQVLPGVMNGRCRYEIRISTKGYARSHIFHRRSPCLTISTTCTNRTIQDNPTFLHSATSQDHHSREHGGTIMTNYVFYMSLHSSLCFMIYSGPGEQSL